MQLPSRRFFLTIIVSSLALTALLGIVAILTSALGDVGSKVLGTTIAVDVAAVLALCCAGKTQDQLHKTVQFLGVLSALIALLFAIYLVWADSLFSGGSEGMLRAFGVFSVLAVAAAHSCLILPSMNYNQNVRTIVRSTLLFIAVVAELLINYFAIPNFSPGDSYGKAIGVFLILDVLGTILIPLVRRFTPAEASVGGPVT
jgi:hypothetical protein